MKTVIKTPEQPVTLNGLEMLGFGLLFDLLKTSKGDWRKGAKKYGFKTSTIQAAVSVAEKKGLVERVK